MAAKLAMECNLLHMTACYIRVLYNMNKAVSSQMASRLYVVSIPYVQARVHKFWAEVV